MPPTKVFKYPSNTEHPKGSFMCRDGLVRAAYLGYKYLNDQLSLEELHQLAKRGEGAVRQGATANKRELITYMVYRNARTGALPDYVDKDGNFVLNSGQLSNLKDNIHKYARRNLKIEID